MGYKLKNKIVSFFFDCISFNTPIAIVFNISIIFLLLIIIPFNSLTYSPFKCIFKYVLFPILFRNSCPTKGILFDCNCPACGMTRGMSKLLKGDISTAMEYNILVIPLFLVLVFLWIFNGKKIIQKYFKERYKKEQKN
ncbi:MAG: DUF2752 domain-containing protein [Candidatus Woesearchaeota archaeon]